MLRHLYLLINDSIELQSARNAGPNCIGAPGPMTAQPNLFDSQYYNEVSHRAWPMGMSNLGHHAGHARSKITC